MSFFSKLFKKKEDSQKIALYIRQTVLDSNLDEYDVNDEDDDFDYRKPEQIIPEFQGDYAKTLFLYEKKKPSEILNNSDYQQYLKYDCGIKFPREYHQQLIEEGYFEKISIYDALFSLKVTELKLILKELECTLSGKKDDLVKRILENATQDQLDKYKKDNVYCLSEKGKSFISDHDYYISLHEYSYYGISWKDYDLHKKDNESAEEFSIRIIKKRLEKHYRHPFLDYTYLYELYKKIDDKTQACTYLLKRLYLETSGVQLIPYIRSCYSSKSSKIQLAEAFTPLYYPTCQYRYLIDNKDEIDVISLVDEISNWKIPLNICSKDLFKRIVLSIIEDSIDEDYYNKSLRESLLKFLLLLKKL